MNILTLFSPSEKPEEIQFHLVQSTIAPNKSKANQHSTLNILHQIIKLLMTASHSKFPQFELQTNQSNTISIKSKKIESKQSSILDPNLSLNTFHDSTKKH